MGEAEGADQSDVDSTACGEAGELSTRKVVAMLTTGRKVL